MARTTEITRVVGNRGRAFGSYKKTYKRKGSPTRSNTGGEILAYNLATGNPGARKGNMATRKRKSYKKPGSKRHYKANTGKRHHYKAKANTGHRRRHYRRNAGESMGSVGGLVTTGTFAIVGALGSKLGAQMVLGTNNTGPIGYLGNAAAGFALWLAADKVLKNRGAAHGIAIGTVVQIILRVLNDYTPFGTYLSNLGMGDYQVQGYTQPQVLVDPVNSSQILVPNGWGGMTPAPAPAPAAKGIGAASYDGGLFGSSY